MKKIAVIMMLFAMVMSLLGGCVRIPKNLIPKPSASQSDNDNEETPEAEETEPADVSDAEIEDDSDSNSGVVESLAPAGNPSEGFSNYSTYKSSAYERISAIAEESDALSMTVAFGYLGVTMIDLSLLSLAMITDDIAGSEMAMGMLGMEGVKIAGSGNDYTITYTDSEGASIKQTCSYDPGKDQLTTTLYDGDGKISLFFEYVNLGGAYAAQYYYPSEDMFEVIQAYFDKDNVAAFGIMTASSEPSSILGKSGFNEEFVKNEESYLILKDGKLTAFDNGTITTN